MNTAKPLQSIVRLAAVCLSITFLAATSASARTWMSADGKSNFEGDLIAYDAGTGEVTVNREGNKITFNQSLLSEKDIAFLKTAKPVVIAEPAAVKPSAKPSVAVQQAASGFEPAFKPAPGEGRWKNWLIRHFGPVGIGIMLENGKVMKIENVEEGSPAEKAGNLKKGQIIESINGVNMTDTDRDPRMVLGELITQAEASDGRIDLKIKGGDAVTVNIPVMGSYSPTWPLNCEKSDKIVRNLAEQLVERGKGQGSSVLFLLSTGEEKDLNVVREWMKDLKSISAHNWNIGLNGMGVCEYYLRTGDATVLPVIQEAADHLRDNIYNGAWSGRGASFHYQSGGQLNAAGVHCLTFLLLAKTCGVDVDEATLQSSLRQFYRFSGRGTVPYGNFTPKSGFTDDNGKTGGLALAMAAATRLTPDGDESIYAKSEQISSMKSYYGTNAHHVGHTGGGIGEIWKSASMGLMTEKRPDQYRDYMDARKWKLELSRRHNGGIGIGGGSDKNYDAAVGEHSITWGTFFALNYTMPRKHLHLSGAPLSKWAKSYALPERPWGTAEDDDFSSPFPVPGGPLSDSDVFKETLRENVSRQVAEQLDAGDVSEETIRTYLHHPEITYRSKAGDVLVESKKYDDLILELLSSEDARLRHTGVMVLHELFGTWRKNNMDPGRVSPAMMDQVEKIIRDPEGSWFVKQWALGLLQHVDIEKLRTFRELLVTLIGHEEQWIQGSAISASIPLLSDKESYKMMFPPIAEAISKTTVYSIITRAYTITEGLKDAPDEIQSYGLELMKTVYLGQPDELVSERGIYVIPDGGPIKRQAIGKVVGFSNAGMDFLDSMPKVTSEWKKSGKDEDLYVFDGNFKPNKAFQGLWCFVGHGLYESKEEATKFLTERLKEGKVPPLETRKINYGLDVKDNGEILGIGFTRSKYTFPMRYSGNMTFSTFIDKAYDYEVVSIGDREFLIMEWDFKPEIDKDFKTVYYTYVKVNPRE